MKMSQFFVISVHLELVRQHSAKFVPVVYLSNLIIERYGKSDQLPLVYTSLKIGNQLPSMP